MIYTITNPGVKFIFTNSDFLLTICNMSEYFIILYDEWENNFFNNSNVISNNVEKWKCYMFQSIDSISKKKTVKLFLNII